MKYMCQKIRNLLFHTLIPAVLAVMLLPMTAFADGSSCSVSIPVEVQVSGSNVPSDVSYKLVMEAITPGAPMPEVTEVTVEKNKSAAFGPMIFTVPEDYQYKVSQKYEAKDNFTFDDKVYTVTVRILNGENGGLVSEVWATPGSDGEKKSANIVFGNSYEEPKKPSGGGSTGGGGGGKKRGDGLTTITDENPPLTSLLPEEIPLAGLPKTGDTTNLALWMLLMAVSGCGLVLSLFFRKRFA